MEITDVLLKKLDSKFSQKIFKSDLCRKNVSLFNKIHTKHCKICYISEIKNM